MRRRWRAGYADFGRIQIPPLPFPLILTDRADGTLWLVSYTLTPPYSDGYGFITINSTLPTRPNRRIYAANEEPWLPAPYPTRLIVRNGYLGVEITDFPQAHTDQDQAPLYATVGLQRAVREIISSTEVLGEYAWVPTTVAS